MAEEQIVTNIVAKSDFSNLITDLNKVSSALTKLQDKLIASNKNLAAQVAVANRSFEATLRSTGQFATHFVSLTSDVDKFGTQLDKGQIKLRQFFNVYQNHIKTNNGLIRDLAKQQVQLQNAILQPLGKNAQGLMQYNVHIPQGIDVIANKTKIAKQELAIMNRLVQEGAGQLINWGKNTQWAGRQLTVGLTVPIMAFGKAASDAFLKADQELVRLTKVYGGLTATSSAELTKVRKDVSNTAKELSKSLGASFNETLGLAADIAATGKTGNELLGSVRETTRLAVLGEVDRQEAMKATLAIQSAFKQNTTQLADSINFLNAVENQTSTSLADLVEAIPKAGPVVKGLGGDIKDLALYLTAMKEGGVNATEGANAIKSAMASLINPTKVATAMFADFGIDLKGIVTSNAGNLTQTILALQAALDRLNPLQKQQALEQLFGKFQFARMNALFENLGRQGSQTLQVLDLMKASSQDLANIAGRELSQVTESASGKYRRAIEGLRADLSDIGDQFLNINTKLINFVDGVIKFMDKLPGPVKQALSLLGGITALAGPLIMLTGVLGNFFGYIIKGIYHFKSFFKNAEGWKLLTPEILAAQKAGTLVEQTFYSDAKAAAILRQAIDQLAASYDHLHASSTGASVPVTPGFSTTGGSPLLVPNNYARQVNPRDPYVGQIGTRAAAHNRPLSLMSDAEKAAQTIFSVTPGPRPVNQKIGAVPQIFTHTDMPNVPGVTTIKGVSTGVVAGEAAKWHSMMGMLSMLTKKEVATLKTEIQNTGTMSAEFMQAYSTLFPQVSNVIDNTVAQSARVVELARTNQITVQQARTRIIALNAEMETMLAQVTTQAATSLGRTADLTSVPLLNQPVAGAGGKSNMKELFREKRPESRIIDRIARLLGVKTYGAGYSTQTTIPKRLNSGGRVYNPSKDGNVVPGDTSINYDNTPAILQEGGYILNQQASKNNPDLVNLAKNSYEEGGKVVPALLTPGETYFPPNVTEQILPTLEQANSGSRIKLRAVGGRVQSGVTNYGIPAWTAFQRLKLINSRYLKAIPKAGEIDPSKLGWTAEFRARSIMHDTAILSERGMPRDVALAQATRDFEDAFTFAVHKTGKDKGSINNRLWMEKRKQQYEALNKTLKNKGYKPLRSSSRAAVIPNVKTIQFLRNNAEAFGGIEHVDRILKQLHMLDDNGKILSNKGLVSGNMVTEHTIPYAQWGYTSAGNYGQAMWGEFNINAASNYLRSQTTVRGPRNNRLQGFTFFPDQLIKTDKGLQKYQDAFKSEFGMTLEQLLEFEKRGITALPAKLRKMVSPTPESIKEIFGNSMPRPVYPYAVANMGGLIGGRVSSSKFNYGRKLGPRPQPKPPMLGPDIPPDPRLAHGVHQIGRLGQEFYIRNRFQPRNIGYYLPALYGNLGKLKAHVGIPDESLGPLRYSARGAHRAPWPIGDESYQAKQALYRYMKGDYSVLKEPGVQDLLSGIREKATGTFYRGLSLGKGALPKHIEDALMYAKTTGDYSPLIGQTFIMRRSSWSSNQETAAGFGDMLFEAFIKNRNVVPASKLFPTLELPTGKGGMATFNESESYFGGKFKILDANEKGVRIEGVRADGGDVKYNKAYIVGEKGPELFIPHMDGGIVPNYALGGKVKSGKGNYGRQRWNPDTKSWETIGGSGSISETPLLNQQETTKAKMGTIKGGILGNIGSIGGMLAGQAVGSRFGALGSIGGSIIGGALGDIAAQKLLQRSLGESANKASILRSIFTKMLAAPPWLKFAGTAGLVTTALIAINNEIKKHRAIVTQAFAPTKDTVQKLGLSFVNLNDRIKQANDQINLFAKSGALFNTQNNKPIAGINLTIKELDDLKNKVKKDFPDLVAVFDKARPDEVIKKATSLKAQFVSGGMAAQDASNLVYALVSASNDAGMALDVLANKNFRNVTDKSSAASASIKEFQDLLSKGNKDQLGASFDQVMNSLLGVSDEFAKTKDSQGQLISQSEVFSKTINYIGQQYGKNKELQSGTLDILKEQIPLLQNVLGSAETMESAFAKIKLYTAGINYDLSQVDPAKATAIVETILKVQTALGSTTGPYKDLAIAIANAEKASKATSSATVKAAQRTQESIQNEIDLRNKNIDAIKKEYDAKKKSLQEQQQDEDTLTEIRKKQLEYQNALATGDQATAAQAQLDIQSLVSKQQRTLATRALDTAEEKAIAKEQAKVDSLTAQLKATDKVLQNAAETAANGAERLAKLAPLLAQVVKATIEFPSDQIIDETEKGAIKSLIGQLKSVGGMKNTISILEQTLQTPPPGIAKPGYENPMTKIFNETFGKAIDQTNGALNVNLVSIKDFTNNKGAKTGTNTAPKVSFTPGMYGTPDSYSVSIMDLMTNKTSLAEQTVFTGADGKKYKIIGRGPGGERALSMIVAPVTKAKGGFIKGFDLGGSVIGTGTGTSDSIPAMLSNGEYVVNAKSVAALGVPFMNSINKMASGGLATYDIPSSRLNTNSMAVLSNNGSVVYQLHQTVNAAEGMNEERLADLASRKTLEMIQQINLNKQSKIGPRRVV